MSLPKNSEAPPSGWWYRASKEQRLAQMDGAIECGMTAPQFAMVVGCLTRHTILRFAHDHGRHFPSINRLRGARHQKRVGDLKRAYFHGYGHDFTDHADHSAPAEFAEVVLE